MDGNGRWASRRGLPRKAGHKFGAEVFGKIARHAARRGIAHLTVYAFSTENWNRPQDEVDAIMDLLRSYLSNVERYTNENMRVRVLGGRAELDADIREEIDRLERLSAERSGMMLNIALNYGGRDEILCAARAFARQCRDTGEEPDNLDFEQFASLLYTAGQPEIDLVIRTSGERRISNFMLWQSAYAEYIFTDTLWPDYTEREFDAALVEYAARSRRMGGV